jgi:HEAT repeat protein
MAAAMGLGVLGYAEAVPALVTALDDPGWRRFGSTAWEALVRLGSVSTPALVQALANGSLGQRRLAARALTHLGRAGDTGVLRPLRTALGDAESTARWEAVEALAWATAEGAAPDARALVADPDADVRDAAIQILGLYGTPTDLEALDAVRLHGTGLQWEGERVADTAAWAMERIRARVAGADAGPAPRPPD